MNPTSTINAYMKNCHAGRIRMASVRAVSLQDSSIRGLGLPFEWRWPGAECAEWGS